jgi:hypothetical protein
MTTHRRKARRLLQAATPTTNDRAVAQLEPNSAPRLKGLGGGEADSWNSGIGHRLGGALPACHSPDFAEVARASLQGLTGIKPNDPIEGMLASQIIAAHEAAMHLRQLAWHPDQSFVEGQTLVRRRALKRLVVSGCYLVRRGIYAALQRISD